MFGAEMYKMDALKASKTKYFGMQKLEALKFLSFLNKYICTVTLHYYIY